MGEQNNFSDLYGQSSANYDYILELCSTSGVDSGTLGNPVSSNEINESSTQHTTEIDGTLQVPILSIKISDSKVEAVKEATAAPGARVGLENPNVEPKPEQIPLHLESGPVNIPGFQMIIRS